MAGIVLDPVTYWRLKCLELELRVLTDQVTKLQTEISMLQNTKHSLMTLNNLSPLKAYTADEVTFTLTEHP